MVSRALNRAPVSLRGFTLTWVVLVVIGVIFVFSASGSEARALVGDPYFLVKQHLVRLVLGLGALCASWFVPLEWWKKMAPLWLVGSFVLLVLVFVPGVGLRLNGASRWLSFGGTVFQPIELVKIGMCFFFARLLSKTHQLPPFLGVTGLLASLVILQPDLGSLLIVLCIAFGTYVVAGGELKIIMSLAAIGLVGVSLAIVSSSYRLQRVATFINPESDPLGASFHIRQIILALGNGGIIGSGLGNSKQKLAYIPEASTDSIFAIVGEEVGFLGSLVILLIFSRFWWQGTAIARAYAPRSFENLLVMSIMLWLGSQTLLNLAAVVALAPLTGVPLPFFSYGGTSLVVVLFGVGVITRALRELRSTTK